MEANAMPLLQVCDGNDLNALTRLEANEVGAGNFLAGLQPRGPRETARAAVVVQSDVPRVMRLRILPLEGHLVARVHKEPLPSPLQGAPAPRRQHCRKTAMSAASTPTFSAFGLKKGALRVAPRARPKGKEGKRRAAGISSADVRHRDDERGLREFCARAL